VGKPATVRIVCCSRSVCEQPADSSLCCCFSGRVVRDVADCVVFLLFFSVVAMDVAVGSSVASIANLVSVSVV